MEDIEQAMEHEATPAEESRTDGIEVPIGLEIGEYGQALRLEDLEHPVDLLIRTYLGCSQSETVRDATHVQYELLIDVQRHRRKAKPVFRRETFFGRLERVVVFTLPPSPPLNITEETTFILTDILPCQVTQDQYAFYEYSSYGAREMVNLNAIRALVGRIYDRGKWVIVRRKGGIEHAHYTSEEDTIVG
ncbi:hypothetical protein FRC00_007195 [Tulasnella sp. 408]|nr:hypothetical protein FRC00_007195 [Tulasnella sp. 408]